MTPPASELGWLEPPSPYETDLFHAIHPPTDSLWAPLEQLCDQSFGPCRLQDLLRGKEDEPQVKDTKETSTSCEEQKSHDHDKTSLIGRNFKAAVNDELSTTEPTAVQKHPAKPSAGVAASASNKVNANDTPKANEARQLAQARALMTEGARALSCYEPADIDLKTMPQSMTSFSDAVTLWPYQRAGVGRLEAMLLVHFCALLAFEMGLGKTLVTIS